MSYIGRSMCLLRTIGMFTSNVKHVYFDRSKKINKTFSVTFIIFQNDF